MKHLLILLGTAAILSSCAVQPECTGEDVKEVLFEIVDEQYKKEIYEDAIAQFEAYSMNEIVPNAILNLRVDFFKNNLIEGKEYLIINKEQREYVYARNWKIGELSGIEDVDENTFFIYNSKGWEKYMNYLSNDFKTDKKSLYNQIVEQSKIYADSTINAMPSVYALNGIRVNSRNEELRRCDCAAELLINSEKAADIEYYAQYTEDDQVYVEMSY